MTRVNRSADCGNSPKNRMVEDIAIALESRDTDFLSNVLDAEANWNYVGGTKTTAVAILEQVDLLNTPTSLAIDRVMSHGKVGAVNGSVEQRTSKQRFCHVVEFTSVKCNRVRRIESYGSCVGLDT